MRLNQQRYQNLPDDLKRIVDEYSGEALTVRFGKAWDQAIDQVRNRIAGDDAHTIITLDDAAYQAMLDASQSVVDDWVASDDGGLDRQALFDGLQKTVKEYTPELAR